MAHLWCTLLNTFLVRVSLQTKGVWEEYKSPWYLHSLGNVSQSLYEDKRDGG